MALIYEMYQNNVLLYDDGISFKPIPERVGVKQGDPLSGLLFRFYLAPALQSVDMLNLGFRFANGTLVSATAYEDDSLLFAATFENMCAQLAAMVRALNALGLELNIEKCVSHSATFSHGCKQMTSVFHIKQEPISQSQNVENLKYLGRQFDGDFFMDAMSYSEKALALATAIEQAPLSPWYQLEALKVFVYSKLHYLMRVAHLRDADLRQLDQNLKVKIRKICALPEQTPLAYIEGPTATGCMGFPSLVMWRHAHVLAQFISTINNNESPVSELARACLFRTLSCETVEQAVIALTQRVKRTDGLPRTSGWGIGTTSHLRSGLLRLSWNSKWRTREVKL